MSGRDLGQVQPPSHGSRWSWPFDLMKPGDFFVVDQVDKPHGMLANIVKVSGHRLGKRFSVIQHPDMIGYTLVTCKDWGDATAPMKNVLTLDWHKFEQLMIEHGALADDRMIAQASYSWPVSWERKPRMDEVRLKLFDGFYAVRFEDDRVVSRRHGGEAERIAMPVADKGDMFGSMFAGEAPVDAVERKQQLLD